MSKKYLSQSEETYKTLQPFESVEEMDESLKLHKQTCELGDTDRAILDVISRYACKYKGVCYLSKRNIAEEAGFRSRQTAIRACKRLEALGIIKQHETRRIKGDRRQSTNVIVIQPIKPIESVVTPESNTVETPAKANKNNTIDTDNVIKRGLKHALPPSIYKALAPFFDGQTLYDTYGILLRAKASVDRTITVEQHDNEFIDAFYNVIRLYKAGKVRSFNGLLYSAWQSVAATIKRRLCSDKHPILYDWLAVRE